MQDQGKRLLVAVVLALAVLMLWQKIFPPKDQDQPGKGSGSAVATAVTGIKPTSHVGYSGEAPAVTPQLIQLDFPQFIVTFSDVDAAVKSWHLTDQRYRDDATHGELVNGDGVMHVGFTADSQFTKESTFKLPKHAVWTGTRDSATQVTYKLSTDKLDLVKTFTIVPDAYLVRMTIKVTVKAATNGADEQLVVTSFGKQDPKQDGGGSSRVQARVWQSSTLHDGSIVQTDVKDVIEHPRKEDNIQWTGFEHPFLLVGFAPAPMLGAPITKFTYGEDDGRMRTDIVFPPTHDLAFTRDVVGYLGPKNYAQLNNTDAAAGFSTGFNQTIDLGWFAFIGRPLQWLLVKFHEFVGNWGVAIIMLTLLVKLITLYWMTKSMRSMKAMAVLAPQLKELNEKYKGDKPRLQAETMALYKQNGANPLSGCLPMFLQMPIWIALYRMLSQAGELYRQPFIPGWINDLTIADPAYVLPVVLVVTMFAQARLTPQNPDPAQRTQQRIMQYGMPLLFGGMAFVFPAGLTLYIFTNTCLSALHSIYMNKFDKKSLELAAKIKAAQEKAAAAKANVKGAKDANPKSEAKRAITSGDDDADDEPRVAAAPRVRPQQRKKKKGRR